MNKKIIISDASPLIAFARIKQLSLLVAIGKLIIPVAVLDECVSEVLRPGAIEIRRAVDDKTITLCPDPNMHNHQTLLDTLGKGEATAIALASESNTLLLIDEKQGRKVAEKMNIKIIGTCGVLLRAKAEGIIDAVLPLIQGLRSAGYRLADELINAVLKRAGE